jgi:hypothetical protein
MGQAVSRENRISSEKKFSRKRKQKFKKNIK